MEQRVAKRDRPIFGAKPKGFAKSRPAAQNPPRPGGPAARRPSGPQPAAFHGPAARRPGGSVLIFHSLLTSGKSTRSCTDLHQVWACKMEIRSSCMTPWSVLSVERLSLALSGPVTNLLSQALIFRPKHWSSAPCTDLLFLALISICPLHWSSVPSTDELLTKMDDGEFEFVYCFNNHFNLFSIVSFVACC